MLQFKWKKKRDHTEKRGEKTQDDTDEIMRCVKRSSPVRRTERYLTYCCRLQSKCKTENRKWRLFLCLRTLHKDTYGSGGIAPRILNLHTRWMWVFSFTLRSYIPGKRGPGTQWMEGWVGTRVGLDAVAKTEILPLLGIELLTSSQWPISNITKESLSEDNYLTTDFSWKVLSHDMTEGSKDSRPSGRNLNPGPSENEVRLLTTRPSW
jgi:hypothetical protein